MCFSESGFQPTLEYSFRKQARTVLRASNNWHSTVRGDKDNFPAMAGQDNSRLKLNS